MKNCTVNPENGLFFPPVMMGQRDLNIFPIYGEYHFTGAVEGPLFPTNTAALLTASIGGDGARASMPVGNGTTGAAVSGGFTGTLTTTVASGVTSISFTLSTGSAPATGQFIQLDTNTASNTAECRKITAVSGTGPYTLTLDVATNYGHTSGVAITQVQSPFSHTIVQQNLLDSLTIEKNLGSYQSEQYAGCRIQKFAAKIAAGQTEANFVADVVAQNYAVLTSPSAITVTNEPPFVFAEATLALYGTNVYQIAEVAIDIENGIKQIYTLSGQHLPQFLSPVTRKITGNLKLVFSSLNDATYGYFNQLFSQAGGTATPGAMSLTLLHPGTSPPNNFGVTLSLQKVALKKYQDDLNMDNVIYVTLDWEAYLNLAASPVNNVGATIIDGQWLPL